MGQRRDGPRPAVIGTCILSPEDMADSDEHLRASLDMVDRVAQKANKSDWGLDLVLLPEHTVGFPLASTGQYVQKVAEPLDGPIVTSMAEKARAYNTYAAVPMHLRDGGHIYNSVVMLDRKGEPIGAYHKVHPVLRIDGSLEHGTMPGREFPLFELDFGRVGVQICWDIIFKEGWQALADQDAELVLFSTCPPSGLRDRAYAREHGYYVASATWRPPAAVIDPVGRVIASTSQEGEALVARIDLDYRVLHSNCLWEWPQSRLEKYAGRITMDGLLVHSLDPELPVRRFLEIEGLLTGRQRLRRNTALLEEVRGGPPVMPEPVERE